MTDKDLINISKPARYIAGELNSIIKDISSKLHFCLIFPDIYEIASSHIGLKILYERVNESDMLYCERFFAPWLDAVEMFGEAAFRSLESKTALKDFDALGFSFNYELSYTTALSILKYSNIALRSADRKEEDPIIIAGGSCMYNPAPLKPFFDIFYIGEGDINLRVILEDIKLFKDNRLEKKEILKKLNDKYNFLYIPSIDAEKVVMKDIYTEFSTSNFCYKPFLPIISAIQDRVAIEIARGCTASCRFCQAGMIYRPVRERDMELVIKDIISQLDATGYLEASLLSLSTGDFSNIERLIRTLNEILGSRNINLSTPSLRADSLSKGFFEEISKTRTSGFTIAPEAGSQRMRDVINKNITIENLEKAISMAAENGYSAAKLYFMIGLPFEQDEDILEIAKISKHLEKLGRSIRKGSFSVSVSVSHFVPKAQTPFQVFGQVERSELERRMFLLKDELKRQKLSFKFHDTRMSLLEAVMSRGDESLADILEAAAKKGDTFYLNSWGDFFDIRNWQSLAEACNYNLDRMATKSYQLEDKLPWDNISTGISKDFFKSELARAESAVLTGDCRHKKCERCGVCDFKVIRTVKSSPIEEDKIKEFIRYGEQASYKVYEVHYKRLQNATYLSALDLIRLFISGLNSYGVTFRFSEGFNKHPKVSTWLPLPLGIAATDEVFCFEAEELDKKHFLENINSKMVSGIEIFNIKEIKSMKTGTSFISTYELYGKTKQAFDSLLRDNKLEYSKKDKKGRDKVINIDSFLKDYDISNGRLELISTNAGSFNLLEALKPHIPISELEIKRTKVIPCDE